METEESMLFYLPKNRKKLSWRHYGNLCSFIYQKKEFYSSTHALVLIYKLYKRNQFFCGKWKSINSNNGLKNKFISFLMLHTPPQKASQFYSYSKIL